MLTEARPELLNAALLYDVTRRVAAAATPSEIYAAALECIEASLGADKSAILLFDEHGVMRFEAWRGLSDGYRSAVEGHSPWAPGASDPQPVLVPDVADDASLAPLLEVVESEGIRSLAFIPLVIRETLLGKFMVYYEAAHRFSDAEVMVGQTIAAQVAFAIDQRQSRERYRALIGAMGLAVYTTDAEGQITLFNEAAAELWGRRPELGVDLWCGSWKLYQPDGTPMAHEDCPMGIALRENRAVRGAEIVAERPDGSRAAVMPYPTPLRDSNGRLVGAVNVLVDITDQKRMDGALREALRGKDDFLGQVSHELRTPLTQLVGNAEILLRRWSSLDAETQHESLEEVHLQALRLGRLVENMMVLSRFERGVLSAAEPQLVQRLVRETVAEFQRRFPHTEIRLQVDPDLPPVESTPSTVDQVIWNLLTNAQKYGPVNGPIEVSARCAEGFVELVVRDEGPGVPEADLPRLFEPYFRSSAIPEQAAGLGLGLSVCKRLIEAQDGEMWARRRSPSGMEFGLRLPAVADCSEV